MLTAEFWEITRVVFIKSLWWIIPTIGWILAMAISERNDYE